MTYNPPRAKTPINAYFWRLGSCRRSSTGIGRIRMAMSVAMLREAFVNQIAVELMQRPPGIVLSQKYDVGVHIKAVPSMDQIPTTNSATHFGWVRSAGHPP